MGAGAADTIVIVLREVAYGSISSFWPRTDDFRSTPISRHFQRPSACLKGANKRHMRGRKLQSLFDHLVSAGEQRGRHGEPEVEAEYGALAVDRR